MLTNSLARQLISTSFLLLLAVIGLRLILPILLGPPCLEGALHKDLLEVVLIATKQQCPPGEK